MSFSECRRPERCISSALGQFAFRLLATMVAMMILVPITPGQSSGQTTPRVVHLFVALANNKYRVLCRCQRRWEMGAMPPTTSYIRGENGLRMRFQELAEDSGGVFAELAVFGAEGGGKMTVDVEFADNFAVHEDRDNNFGLGFERAGQVAGV